MRSPGTDPGPPPPHVRSAFGTDADPVHLPGGSGRSWRCGDLVLKPDGAPDGSSWLADLLAELPADGFRLSRPVRVRSGRSAGLWAVDGWTAGRWVAGESGPVGHWPEVLAAARSFHRALEGVGRPPALDRRDDRWARADGAAWEEEPRSVAPGLAAVVARLRALTLPVELPVEPPVELPVELPVEQRTDPRAQLVHGDLSGNVLLAAGLAPAIIDVSPYWRPPAYAEAVAVGDGLVRWDEGDELLDAAGRAGDPALVARGLLFRLFDLDEHLRVDGRPVTPAARAPYERATALLERRAGRAL